MKTKYSVYKITNKIDDKIYIGCHKTDDLDDDYMGSGKYLCRAQEKYGIENFKKEILAVFDKPEDMFDMESTLVNEDFINRKDTYNLVQGGKGGFVFARAVHDELMKNDEEYRARYGEAISKSLKRRWAHAHDNGHVICSFKGHKHSEEAKRKIGKITSIAQKGKGNSQYGSCWVFKDKAIKIKKEELDTYLANGWIRGNGKKGIPRSKEVRAKMSAAAKGRTASAETKLKMSIAQQKRRNQTVI